MSRVNTNGLGGRGVDRQHDLGHCEVGVRVRVWVCVGLG